MTRSALQLATDETVRFVRRVAPGACRLLEVGCGGGEVAVELVRAGYDVVAVEADAELVKVARARGAAVRLAEFPDFADDDSFDVVLFTRSLHHLEDLDGSLRRARDLLASGGRVVVEDWAWNHVDRATAEWAYGLMQFAGAAGLLDADEWRHDGDPLRHWMDAHRHDHAIHEAEAMLAAAGRHLVQGRVETCPYFYRYFCGSLGDHARGAAICEHVFETEQRLIAGERIRPLGLRFCATRPSQD